MQASEERGPAKRRSVGVLDRAVAETPVAIFDLETTGFPAGRHRVVEMSICRTLPDGSTNLVFDSLIDPGRPVTGHELHGITDRDVEGAPRFEEVAAEIVDHLAGAVVASYNVTFDIDFLHDELSRVGVDVLPPHICLMFLRPMLGLGGRCSLEEACRKHEVDYEGVGCARGDTEAAGDLFRVYRSAMKLQRIETFADLAARGAYPFLSSLELDPLASAERLGLYGRGPMKRRILRSLDGASAASNHQAMRRYWHAVSVVLADLDVSDAELGLVRALRDLLQLSEEQVRAVHARAFLNAMVAFTGDDWLDDEEAAKTARLLDCLSKLGWAPGE